MAIDIESQGTLSHSEEGLSLRRGDTEVKAQLSSVNFVKVVAIYTADGVSVLPVAQLSEKDRETIRAHEEERTRRGRLQNVLYIER